MRIEMTSASLLVNATGAQFGTFNDPTQPPNGFAVFVDKGLNSFQPKKSQPQVSESTIRQPRHLRAERRRFFLLRPERPKSIPGQLEPAKRVSSRVAEG